MPRVFEIYHDDVREPVRNFLDQILTTTSSFSPITNLDQVLTMTSTWSDGGAALPR